MPRFGWQLETLEEFVDRIFEERQCVAWGERGRRAAAQAARGGSGRMGGEKVLLAREGGSKTTMHDYWLPAVWLENQERVTREVVALGPHQKRKMMYK